jgi:hypothetical protein
MVTQAGVANDPDKVKEAVEVILKEHKKIANGDIKMISDAGAGVL